MNREWNETRRTMSDSIMGCQLMHDVYKKHWIGWRRNLISFIPEKFSKYFKCFSNANVCVIIVRLNGQNFMVIGFCIWLLSNLADWVSVSITESTHIIQMVAFNKVQQWITSFLLLCKYFGRNEKDLHWILVLVIIHKMPQLIK